jgi:uncharacterized protein (TIGR02246 family)
MHPPDEARLLQLEQDLFEALKAKDAEALRRILAEDFVLHAPGAAPVEREAFIASVAAIPGTLLSVEGEGVRTRVYGEVGILTGTQRARVRLEDGTTVTSLGAFTDVALWKDGRWWMVQAHSVELKE